MHANSLISIGMAMLFALTLWGINQLHAEDNAPAQVIESGDQPVTLIELYSSEGCSSCPPAEAWLSRLTSDQRLWKQIVPVAFHVDYWDGLGWPDRFARKAYTQRQYNYAASLGSESVYTPEFIVQGREWRNRVLGLPLNTVAPVGKLRIVTHGAASGVQVTYKPAANAKDISGPLMVHVAWLGLGIVSEVQRGENAGSKLRHDFTVLDFQSLPIMGTGPVDFSPPQLPTPNQPAALAAWVSDSKGAILLVVGDSLK